MQKHTEELVDRILAALDKSKTLVVHKNPDLDSLLCLWLAKRFIEEAKDAKVVFVNAGDRLPGSEDDPSVLHFDTGGGEYDQHGKALKKISSATLVAEKLGLLKKHPGIAPLLDLAQRVDNIEPIPPTDIHYILKGLPQKHKLQDGTPDWETILGLTFDFFDIVSKQESQRIASRNALEKFSRWHTLPNGLKVAIILWHPELRDAAFERGAAVVIWTVTMWRNCMSGEILTESALRARAKQLPEAGNPENKFQALVAQERWERRFYTGIQRNREHNDKRWLLEVAHALRKEENKERGADIRGKNFRYIGRHKEGCDPWMLHDSFGIILNGSRKWTPAPDEYTELSPTKIVDTVLGALS